MTENGYLDRPLEPFYLESNQRRCFSLFFPNDTGAGDAILFVPPFGEEMNRTRPMVSMQARRLAEQGVACLMTDYGCTGDSSGDFRDARWDEWKQDMVRAAGWVEARGYRLIGLWGLRMGALMAAELLHEEHLRADRLLLWQPVTDGKQMMTQFLRIRIAAQMDRGEKQEDTKTMRQRLAQGELLEIAGYELSGELSSAIERRKLTDSIPPRGTRVDWIEARPATGDGLSRPAEKVIGAWREHGVEVNGTTFDGPPFWQLHEREMAPDIIEKTTGLL